MILPRWLKGIVAGCILVPLSLFLVYNDQLPDKVTGKWSKPYNVSYYHGKNRRFKGGLRFPMFPKFNTSDATKRNRSAAQNVVYIKLHRCASITISSIFIQYGLRANLSFVLPKDKGNYQ